MSFVQNQILLKFRRFAKLLEIDFYFVKHPTHFKIAYIQKEATK